jgi:hypothetical protein
LPCQLRTASMIGMAKFTVDTHLFRELGELLVGRDSTALVELIKNSYDADARHVMRIPLDRFLMRRSVGSAKSESRRAARWLSHVGYSGRQ